MCQDDDASQKIQVRSWYVGSQRFWVSTRSECLGVAIQGPQQLGKPAIH